MATRVVMPQMGESLSEGTIAKWLKKVGERVERDEPLFEITTDKVDTEVPAPAAGVVEKILVGEGETVAVDTVVAIIASGDTGRAAARPEAGQEKTPEPEAGAPSPPDTGGHFKTAHEPVTFQRRTEGGSPPREEPAPVSRKGFLSPAVLALAAEHALPIEETREIEGTGAGGRVTRKDVERYLADRKERPPSREPAAPAPEPPAAPPPPAGYWPYPYPFYGMPPGYPPPHPPGAAPPPSRSLAPGEHEASALEEYPYRPEPGDSLVPMTASQRQIAREALRAHRHTPQLTFFSECDMYRIARYRDVHREEFESAEGIPLTFLPFVAEAVVKALKELPIFNASVLGDRIVMRKHVHLGVAVALDDAVVVPVVQHADEMNFVGLARAIHDLGERSRRGALAETDLAGATFTVTNPGLFGGLMGTPMVRPPQVAVLALGAVQKKPVVIDDGIAIRPMMALALSFDSRIIDPAAAAQFLERMRFGLEELP